MEAPAHGQRGNLALDVPVDPAWRSELATRLAAYRARRRKSGSNDAQTRLPFERGELAEPRAPAVAVAEPHPREIPAEEEFAFTIAIGRPAKPGADLGAGNQVEIDVSPPGMASGAGALADRNAAAFLSPVASLAVRRVAALLDAGCLLFAYGGFLALFSSLGGQFTLSKLSAAIYAATIALFYVQYFAMFTLLGGTTPGMMLRGLDVMSFSGERPTPRQLLIRSAGYILSAGSFFLGFLWACWDEDALTWHDRLSQTHLTASEPLAHGDAPSAARSH